MQWTIDRLILARRWDILIAVPVLAVLSGMIIALNLLPITVVVGFLIISTLIWWRLEFLFLALCLGTFGYNLYREHRIYVGNYPLSPLDLIACLIIGRAVVELISPKQKGLNLLPHQRLDWLMLAFFAYINIIGVINGLAEGNPIYGIWQGVRLIVYLYGGYLAGITLVKSPAQLKGFIWWILLSNVAISLWQYYILTVAPGLRQVPIGFGRWVAEYFIEFPNTGFFLAIGLIIYRPTFLKRSMLWILIITWGINVILSFVRNQWVCTGVALTLLPGLLRDKQKAIIGLIAGAIGVLLGMVLIYYWNRDIGNIYMTDLVETVRMSLSAPDKNIIFRIDTTLMGWSMILTNPRYVLLGLGFGAQVVELIIPELGFLDFTDGYLWFLISTGLPGLLFLLILVVSFVRVSFHISRNSANSLYRAFALGQCMYIIFEILRTFLAGGFIMWFRAVYIGFIFGLVASIYKGRLSDKPERLNGHNRRGV